jgi:hypothetical protein
VVFSPERAQQKKGACGGQKSPSNALEEHFAIVETLSDSHGYFSDRVWRPPDQRKRLPQDRPRECAATVSAGQLD